MGEKIFKYTFYTLAMAAIVFFLTNPEVLEDYSERLYVASVSSAYRQTAQDMLKMGRQVRQVERAYEHRHLSKPDTRQKLLGLHYKYQRLLVILSQSNVNMEERDDLIIKIRGAQSAIDRWGAEHGF